MTDAAPETVDTGFDAVIAGEVYAEPETSSVPIRNAPPVNQEVTATVTAPGLTAAGITALQALLPPMPKITPPELAQLAREIAMNVKTRPSILMDFKLSETQYEFLEAYNEFYKAALHAACIEWHAPLSTQERLKVEAAAILEDSLVGLGARMQNKGEGLPGVVEVAKLFAKIADVGERGTGQGPAGERFTINIDLGGDQRIALTTSPPPQEPAQPHRRLSLPGVEETKTG